MKTRWYDWGIEFFELAVAAAIIESAVCRTVRTVL